MKRYFFDLSDGSQEKDDTGSEFASDLLAQREAIRYAGEVLKLEPGRLESGTMRVDVTDDDQSVQFVIEVRLETRAKHRN